MSDPVTNVDIEDVLSSIRRLVSEGDRNAAHAPKAEAAPPSAMSSPPSVPNRFVLTPALRVVERDADPVLPTDQHHVDPSPLILTNDRNLSQLEATIAELEAAVTWQDDDFEPDGSEATATDWSAAPPDLRRRVVDELAGDAEIADAPAQSAEPEVAFHHNSYDETDDDHQDDLLDDDSDEAATDNLTAFLDDDALVDEAALREMVAQIVRQELQGELGERITRNVRKLVRREIYRVINSQEFE